MRELLKREAGKRNTWQKRMSNWPLLIENRKRIRVKRRISTRTRWWWLQPSFGDFLAESKQHAKLLFTLCRPIWIHHSECSGIHNFSWSYCHDGNCHHNVVCLSVRPFVCPSICLWLSNTSYSKCLNKSIGNAPLGTRPYKLQLSTPNTDPMPSNSTPTKFRNFTYLLHHPFLIMWPFCIIYYVPANMGE